MENETPATGTAPETAMPSTEQTTTAAVETASATTTTTTNSETPAVPAVPAENTSAEETCSCCCSCSTKEETASEENKCGECACECAEEEKKNEKEERHERRERVVIPITPEMVDKTRVALITMLDLLGLDGTVKAEEHTTKINLYVNSDDAGRIIGRKGQTLESLQLILNKMMQKENPDFPKVYIDLDGYTPKNERRERFHDDHGGRGDRGGRFDREDRGPRRRSFEGRGPRREFRRDSDGEGGGFSDNEEILRQQAIDASKEVRRWGESKTLPPMNAHDRRIIHITLENEADLVTESSGEGAMKSVTISLKK